MARQNTKPLSVVKSHLTNAEKQHRKQAEEATKTGKPMLLPDELKRHKYATKEFNRIKDLYSRIDHDDEMHTPTLARYCLMREEEQEMLKEKDNAEKAMKQLEKERADIDTKTYYEMATSMQKNYLKILDYLSRHRKMLLDIEKASLLTLSDKMRAIPPKPKEEEQSDMAKFLRSRKG